MSNVTPRVVEYVLEGGTGDLREFNQQIAERLKKGFQPFGPAFPVLSPIFGSPRLVFYQTMVKYYSAGGDD
jgi:hypothetical protein